MRNQRQEFDHGKYAQIRPGGVGGHGSEGHGSSVWPLKISKKNRRGLGLD